MENEHMEQTTDSASPNTQQQSSAPMPKKEGGIGPIIGIIIIIILLGLGGVYYFTAGVDQLQTTENAEDGTNPEAEADELREQNSSTNLADIEADLETTDFSGLDESSADFESELQAQ